MQTVTRAWLIVAAVALLVASAPVLAQDRAPAPPPAQNQDRGPAPPPEQSQASIAQGQLVRVDPNAKVILIKDAQWAQMQFRYTEQTKVSGADETVAGLATMAGAQVSVHFRKQGQDNIATEIEVQKKP